ncbi:DUF6801 domain-containing protein [Nocardioides dongkuii]|uniref:DUF6801 domain-containing protein n=1 Tax=Nocardioides dongkuii TaxID=2760089 RepID=UPI0015F7BDED|nr:DUF6801 domain-containing protein [Nocardioides dongkuii]
MQQTTKTRIAALGAGFALAAGALVSVAPAAQAASVKSDFSCDTEALGAQVLSVTTKVKLPAKVKKGKTVGSKKVTMVVVLPQGLTDALRFIGVTELSGSATGVKAKVGKTSFAVKGVKFTDVKVPASGPMKITAKGTTAAFKIKKPGSYTISIPKKFDFSSTTQNGDPLTNEAPCSLVKGQPTKLGTLKVTK